MMKSILWLRTSQTLFSGLCYLCRFQVFILAVLEVYSNVVNKYYITCCEWKAVPHVTFPLGEEVALYCAKYLPDIIKDQKAYKEGKLQKVCLSIMFFFVCVFVYLSVFGTGD